MVSSPSNPSFSPIAWELTKVFLLLAIVVWGARFWHSADFGLYEDDYTRIPSAVTMTAPQLWDHVSKIVFDFQGQGRPFHPGSVYLFSWLGWKLGGLNSIYWLGYLILTINSFLFYLLLRRVSSQVFAFTGALLFCLFPADTTQTFLTHSLGIMPSLMFFLIASHLYLSDRRTLSYVFILGSLLTYETIYLVFMAAPLLKQKWDSKRLRETISHSLILGLMLSAVVIMRISVGEGRIVEARWLEALQLSVSQAFKGPVVSLSMFLYRPVQVLLALDQELLVGMALFTPIFAWGLSWFRLGNAFESGKNVTRTGSVTISIRSLLDAEFFGKLMDSERTKRLYQLALTGLIMLILAYPLMLTVSSLSISGRATRVHFASVVGASIIGAFFCTNFLIWGRGVGRRPTAMIVLTCFYALLVGFGFLVQREYRTSWLYQRQFWMDIIQLIPDAKEGTVILVEPKGLRDTSQIGANTWNLPRILNHIYEFPVEWGDNPPRVFRLKENWQNNIAANNRSFRINDRTVSGPPSTFRNVESEDVILLSFENGQFTRRTQPLIISGNTYPLKKISDPVLPSLDRGILYDLLIGEESVE